MSEANGTFRRRAAAAAEHNIMKATNNHLLVALKDYAARRVNFPRKLSIWYKGIEKFRICKYNQRNGRFTGEEAKPTPT